MKLVTNGRIPSKKNSRINTRSGLSFPSSKYTAWHKEASKEIVKQMLLNKMPIFPIGEGITLTFYLPDNRRTDLTNKAESIMDMLVDNEVLEDDSWQITGDVTLKSGGVDKINPRCEIEY